MLDHIDKTIRIAVMSILSALYESGVVEEVAMADVMRLFGVDYGEDPDKITVSFRDPGWVESYIDFREREFDDQDDDFVTDINHHGKLH